MTEKDHNGRPALPQGAEARWLAIGVRECDSSQLAAECFRHVGHSLGGRAGCQATFLEAQARILRMVMADSNLKLQI